MSDAVNQEKKTAREALSNTIKEIIWKLTNEINKVNDSAPENDTSYKLEREPYINSLTNVKELLISIDTIIGDKRIDLETAIINSKQNIDSIDSADYIFNSIKNIINKIPINNALDNIAVKTLSTLRNFEHRYTGIKQELNNFILKDLTPALQYNTDFHIETIKLLQNVAVAEQNYITSLQASSKTLDENIATLTEKINKTNERINDLADIATGKSAGEIYGAMAKRQEKESAKYRNWTIATLTFTIAIPIYSYIIGACSDSVNTFHYLYTTMLVAITTGLATYLGRQSARHRSMFEKYNFLEYKHSSFNMFIDKIALQKDIDPTQIDKTYELLKQFINDDSNKD